MYHLTAAHRILPLGATVAVTHLRTGRQVVVRINDRGPYVDSRRCIIDLSRAAACRLGFEHPSLGHTRRGEEDPSPVDAYGPGTAPQAVISPTVPSLNSFVALRASRPAGPVASSRRWACARPSGRRASPGWSCRHVRFRP